MPQITDHREHPHHNDVVVLRKWFRRGMLRNNAVQMIGCAARELQGKWQVEMIGLWIETEYEMSKVCGGQTALLVDKAMIWARANPDPGPNTFYSWQDFSLQAKAGVRANFIKLGGQQEARSEDIVELRMWFKRGMLSGFAKRIMNYLGDKGFLDRKFWTNDRIKNWIKVEKSLYTLHGGEESKVLENAKSWSKTSGHTNPDPLVESTWFPWEDELEIERRRVIIVKSEEPEEGFILQIPIYMSAPPEVKTGIPEQVNFMASPNHALLQTTLTQPSTSTPRVPRSKIQKAQTQGDTYFPTAALQRSHKQERDAAIERLKEIEDEQALLAKQWNLVREARLCDRIFEEEQLVQSGDENHENIMEPSRPENRFLGEEDRRHQRENTLLVRPFSSSPENTFVVGGGPRISELGFQECEQVQPHNSQVAKEMPCQQRRRAVLVGRIHHLTNDAPEMGYHSVDAGDQEFEERLHDETPEEGSQYELLLDGIEKFLELEEDEVQASHDVQEAKILKQPKNIRYNGQSSVLATSMKGETLNYLLANTTEPTDFPEDSCRAVTGAASIITQVETTELGGLGPQKDVSSSRKLIWQEVKLPFNGANGRDNVDFYKGEGEDDLGKPLQRDQPATIDASGGGGGGGGSGGSGSGGGGSGGGGITRTADYEPEGSMELNDPPARTRIALYNVEQSDKPTQSPTTPNHIQDTSSSLSPPNPTPICTTDNSNQSPLPPLKKRKRLHSPRAESKKPKDKKKNKKNKKKKVKEKEKQKEKMNLHRVLEHLNSVAGSDLFRNRSRLKSGGASEDAHGARQAESRDESGKNDEIPGEGGGANITIVNFNIKTMKVGNLFQRGGGGGGMSEEG